MATDPTPDPAPAKAAPKKTAARKPAAAKKTSERKPDAPAKRTSPRKAAAQGAAAGAAGGPQSAAVSGVAAGASQRKANRSTGRRRWGGRSSAHRLLVAELVASVLIVALSPMTDKHKLDSPATFIKRLSAVAALYVILGLVASAGRGPARFAAGFGGLVTLSLMLSSRDVFVVLAQRFGADLNEGPAGPPDVGAQAGGAIGGAISGLQ